MKRNIGGNRLGSGGKLIVNLKEFERSTHDMGYIWRSTMAPGTLVPFLSEVGLPGDTFDIDLNTLINTQPTIGPLFGSFKVQLDVFTAAFRLYQGQLHNNKLGIGMNMAAIKLPIMTLKAYTPAYSSTLDIDNLQINPSCVLSYLGIRGVGVDPTTGTSIDRTFNAIPLLMYYDTYKNYYANKQETNGYIIHSDNVAPVNTVSSITVGGTALSQSPASSSIVSQTNQTMVITCTTSNTPVNDILVTLTNGQQYPASYFFSGWTTSGLVQTGYFNYSTWGNITFKNWSYRAATTASATTPVVQSFPLSQIDYMRELILQSTSSTAFDVTSALTAPWSYVLGGSTLNIRNMAQNQEGLALKTYNSDLFNNWIQTGWIDGAGSISELTKIDTSSGSFKIDTLNLAQKVYDMLNRVAISGGSYDDWLDANYTHERYTRPETPVYQGGLIKELIFEEITSTVANTAPTGQQPLGTLGGTGKLSRKHKGGKIRIRIDEPSWVMGIISITPRLDYSQGNKWDTGLKTMDDLHKPALDEIGFQELITEQMAWWDTRRVSGAWKQYSAGKQPAWLNYMTNVNQARGNFAIANNSMFMTLNRRYEMNSGYAGIKDLTTYIDPSKFNNIFAQTSLDAQNFWVQVAVDMTVRRKISARVMPNL
jgi:hypothetical protein